VNSRWQELRGKPHNGRRRKPRPNTCPYCRRPVIWARVKGPRRGGKRFHVPFPIERCAPGTGNYALSVGFFFQEGVAQLAELVAIGTSYRSHRDNCPALPAKTKTPAPPAAPPRAFSADSFATKKRSGGSR